MYKEIVVKMWHFLAFSVVGTILWNYELFIKLVTYGTDLGNIKYKKDKAEVSTISGKVNIPVLTLPNFDWSVGFFDSDIPSVNDGRNDWSVLEDNLVKHCNIVRNKLICEYMYPHQVNGSSTVRGFVGNIFEQEVYVFTVKHNEPIDYKKYSHELMTQLEDL